MMCNARRLVLQCIIVLGPQCLIIKSSISCQSLVHRIEEVDLPPKDDGIGGREGGDGVALHTTEGTSPANDCKLCAGWRWECELAMLTNGTIENTIIIVNSVKNLLFRT